MPNNINYNSIAFNNKPNLEVFIKKLMENKDLVKAKSDYITQYPQKEKKPPSLEKKNKYEILGYALVELKKITNAKTIYDLYRFATRSEDPDFCFYLDQIQKLFDYVPIVIEDDVCYFFSNAKKLHLGNFIDRERNPVGKPRLENREDKTGDRKYSYSKLSKFDFNRNVNLLTSLLVSNTFSIYSFVEERIREKNTWDKIKGTKYLVIRALAKFGKEDVKISLNDPFGNLIEINSTYRISSIGPVKMSIDILDTYYCNFDASYFSFYFEFDKGFQFEDFAHGHYKKKKFNNSVKLGSSFLVMEKNEEIKEIKEKGCLAYENISDLPERVKILGEYFLQRDKNYIKFPTFENQTFENLQLKLDNLEARQKDLRIFKYKYFISMPILFDSPSKITYNKRLDFFLQVKSRLKIENTYFAAEGKTLTEYEEAIKNKTFGVAIDEIANASHYILIIPKMKNNSEHSTKALLELGVSIFLKRPTLVLVHRDSFSFVPKGISSENVVIRQFSSLDSLNNLNINTFFQ